MLLTKCSKVWGRWDYFTFEVPYAYYAYFLETLIIFRTLWWIESSKEQHLFEMNHL